MHGLAWLGFTVYRHSTSGIQQYRNIFQNEKQKNRNWVEHPTQGFPYTWMFCRIYICSLPGFQLGVLRLGKSKAVETREKKESNRAPQKRVSTTVDGCMVLPGCAGGAGPLTVVFSGRIAHPQQTWAFSLFCLEWYAGCHTHFSKSCARGMIYKAKTYKYKHTKVNTQFVSQSTEIFWRSRLRSSNLGAVTHDPRFFFFSCRAWRWKATNSLSYCCSIS